MLDTNTYIHKAFCFHLCLALSFKLGFSGTSQVIVREPNSTAGKKVKLNVTRSGGSDGLVIIQWRSYPVKSWFGYNDISPLNSNITFLSYETEKVLVIDVEPDNIPEINEVYIFYFLDTIEF